MSEDNKNGYQLDNFFSGSELSLYRAHFSATRDLSHTSSCMEQEREQQSEAKNNNNNKEQTDSIMNETIGPDTYFDSSQNIQHSVGNNDNNKSISISNQSYVANIASNRRRTMETVCVARANKNEHVSIDQDDHYVTPIESTDLIGGSRTSQLLTSTRIKNDTNPSSASSTSSSQTLVNEPRGGKVSAGFRSQTTSLSSLRQLFTTNRDHSHPRHQTSKPPPPVTSSQVRSLNPPVRSTLQPSTIRPPHKLNPPTTCPLHPFVMSPSPSDLVCQKQLNDLHHEPPSTTNFKRAELINVNCYEKTPYSVTHPSSRLRSSNRCPNAGITDKMGLDSCVRPGTMSSLGNIRIP